MHRCQHCQRLTTRLHHLVLVSPSGACESAHVCAPCAASYDIFLATELRRLLPQAQVAL